MARQSSTRALTTTKDLKHLLTVVFDDNDDITKVKVLKDLGIKNGCALTNSPVVQQKP